MWNRWIWPAWYAGGVVLTTATQLRPEAAPVGPGELLLLAWTLAAVALLVHGGVAERPPVARAVAGYWATAIPLLLAGGLWGAMIGTGPAGGFAHDLFAFLYVAIVTVVFTSQPDLEGRVRSTIPLLLLFTVVPLVILFVITPLGSRLGPLQPWYSVRFRGWARNPNQLALSLVAVPFCAAFLYARAKRLRARLGYLVLGVAALVIGTTSLSDALMLAWAVGISLALMVVWFEAARAPSASLPRVAFLRIGIPALVFLALLAGGVRWYSQIAETVQQMYAMGNQGAVRVNLWYRGFQAMLASPLVGNGPGALSGDTAPFQGRESHNTLVDWGASTGLIGIVLYLGMVTWVTVRCLRRGHGVLAVGVISFFVFSCLHYVMRHPIFWYYLVAIETLSRTSAPGPGAAARPPLPARAPELAPGVG